MRRGTKQVDPFPGYRVAWSEDDRAWVAEHRDAPGILGLGETPLAAISYAQIAERRQHVFDARPYFEANAPCHEYIGRDRFRQYLMVKILIEAKGRKSVLW